MFEAKWEKKLYVYFFINIFRDIFSKTAFKVKICEKYKISGMVLIFTEYFDFMNKCSMNEHDSFDNIFSSINHK